MHHGLKILVLGDVIGKPGCRAIFGYLGSLKKTTKADCVVVNGENAFEGKGITPEICQMFFKSGVDVITTGNHIWQQREILPFLDKEDRILRPENYPTGVPGKGHCLITVKDKKVGIINLQGRVFLSPLRCPFQVGKDTAVRLRRETPVVIVDFHAEWTEEKEALAIYLDGTISALVGTHTHVQTADERILPHGTGYITDIGMTGPGESIIGMNPSIVIQKNLSQMPLKMEVADKQADIMGVLLSIDAETGKTVSVERIWEKSVI
ncbi:MAG: TIGR00282 family metallophosphoesterase [Spirochaetales bacterium]|nr:TIGR00282 family metallophosphoesterase [Spirochaetales bacterium]